MLDRIVAHSNPYEQLSPAERDEFNAWLDSCHAQVRDPEPSDFDYVPFDEELDKTADLSGWQRVHDKQKDFRYRIVVEWERGKKSGIWEDKRVFASSPSAACEQLRQRFGLHYRVVMVERDEVEVAS